MGWVYLHGSSSLCWAQSCICNPLSEWLLTSYPRMPSARHLRSPSKDYLRLVHMANGTRELSPSMQSLLRPRSQHHFSAFCWSNKSHSQFRLKRRKNTFQALMGGAAKSWDKLHIFAIYCPRIQRGSWLIYRTPWSIDDQQQKGSHLSELMGRI